MTRATADQAHSHCSGHARSAAGCCSHRWACSDSPCGTPDDAPDWMGALIGFVFFGGASAALINVAYGAADQPSGQLPSGAPALARILSGALGVAVALGLAIALRLGRLRAGRTSLHRFGRFSRAARRARDVRPVWPAHVYCRLLDGSSLAETQSGREKQYVTHCLFSFRTKHSPWTCRPLSATNCLTDYRAGATARAETIRYEAVLMT